MSEVQEHPRMNPINGSAVIFLSFIIVSFVIRMAVAIICPSQEFFLTALFAIGCGGLYSLYCKNLNIEVVSKYKAHGAIAVVLLIFIFMPANETANTDYCGGENKEDQKKPQINNRHYRKILIYNPIKKFYINS